MIELAAVRDKFVAEIVDTLERTLHTEDPATNRNPAAECLSQVLCGRKMIGMGVRLENPVQLQPSRTAVFDDALDAAGAGATRTPIVIEHWIDDGRGARRGVRDHV